MYSKIISSIAIFLAALTLWSCGSSSSSTLTIPTNWPRVNKSETAFREYLDANADSLNPVEGIWTMNESGTWRNVYSGMTGVIPSENKYRLAIVKDAATSAYDFVAVVLESTYPDWVLGKVKGRFRKTAYDKLYDGQWYTRGYSPVQGNYIMDESGLVKNSRTLYDDADVKVVLFGFSAGHELSAHTAPMPAALYFLEGEADLTLGAETEAVKASAFAHMPPFLNHAIVAKTPLVMLLLMMKRLQRKKSD